MADLDLDILQKQTLYISDYSSRDMLNLEFFESSLGLVFPPHFVYVLSGNIFLMLYAIKDIINIFNCLLKKTTKKTLWLTFYGWVSTFSKLEPLLGGSLLFTNKFPETPCTHFIDLWRMKGWVNLGTTQWIWTRDPWIGNPAS